MRILRLLPVILLALQSCSLHERIDKVSSEIEAQYQELESWDQLPVRTISWNQALSMMKRNNTAYLQVKNTITKAERNELSVYTDLIPGISYYSYFTKSIGDLTSKLNSDDLSHNVNVTFTLPSLTHVPYRVYASKAATFAAIKALEGKERELISKLYTQQRKQSLNARKRELDAQKQEQKEAYHPAESNTEINDWMELATLLGDYSARWRILPASVPRFNWSHYRKLTGKLDQLIVCKLALELEQARMAQYSVAITYLPTINLNLYSPSLFSSTGGTYSGTFLDTDDTKLNMSLNYSLDTRLRTWNTYRDSKEAYELRQRETTAKLVELKQKLNTLRTSMDEYYAWRGFMSKRLDYLSTAPAANAQEFLENENTRHSMKQELLNQESAAIESEAALILQYGLR
ncbi:MAG: hypothetical protein E7032_06705 [Akkermansiaceae bacterium]|nr:hypothetical protein [Akkermansiaceae bacterium]